MKGILRDSIRAGNDYKVPAGINHIRAHKASRSVPLTGISVPLTGINVGIRSENKRRTSICAACKLYGREHSTEAKACCESGGRTQGAH